MRIGDSDDPKTFSGRLLRAAADMVGFKCDGCREYYTPGTRSYRVKVNDHIELYCADCTQQN